MRDTLFILRPSAFILAVLLVPSVSAVSAQGFGFGEDEWGEEEKPRELRRQAVLPYAAALETAFSSATWSALKLSTTPAVELTRLMYRGFYRQELIQLILLGRRAGAPLDELARRRDKGASLRALAADYKVDEDALAREAEAKRAEVDALLPTISTPSPSPGLRPSSPRGAGRGEGEGKKDAVASVESATTTILMPGGEAVTAELAVRPDEQERGLMYRTELAPDRGMLFVFPEERVLPFWMKNTWIDLDIVYLDKSGRVTKVFRRVPRSTPQTPDEKVARIHAWGRYVLELPAGAARRYKLKKGQALRFRLP